MKNNFTYNKYIGYINLENADIKEFYKNLTLVNFNDITKERIEELKNSEVCETLKSYIYGDSIKITEKTILSRDADINSDRLTKYLKVINILRVNPNTGTNNYLEKYILFVLIFDPNLDALVIHSSYDKINQIKNEMKKRFGVYDSNLVKIERKILHKLLNKSEIDKLNEKIDSIVYK